MLGPLLSLVLLAAPPRAAVYGHAHALDDLRAFLATASKYAPALAPGPLGRALGAPLAVDALDPSSWAAAGLDPKGQLTAVQMSGGAALVLPVRDANKALAAARASLPSAGAVTESKRAGSTLLVAHRPSSRPDVPGELTAAACIGHGRAALWLGGGGDPEFLRDALTARAPAMEHAKGLQGELFATFLDRPRVGGAIGFTPSATSLGVDARLFARGPVAVAGKPTRFGKLAGALAGHLELAPQAVPLIRAQAEALARAVLARTRKPVPKLELSALLDELAGPVALLATGVQADRGAGSSLADRYFLVSNAYAATVRDPAKAKAALDALVNAMHAAQMTMPEAAADLPGQHVQVLIGPGRTLYFGLSGDALYVANDADARQALLGAFSDPQPAPHAGELVLDGKTAAQQLRRLSILDAARSTDLAALFGLAVEAGPLLEALGTTPFTADPEPRALRIHCALKLP